ncbi:MAG TPA: SCO5389 family protein [Candidatus Baltobacteraceae bacterium]|jgi:hypothetical protein|nr:SCO5389 family protein [Candidatus Baltobacteraceae bacterium]
MSLTVSPSLLSKAQKGDVPLDDFLACIKGSLPYPWEIIASLSERLEQTDADHVDSDVQPPSEQARAQLLRLLASDSMRNSLERHYGMKIAFRNCGHVALFKKDRLGAEYEEFISPRSQILNQRPELVDC